MFLDVSVIPNITGRVSRVPLNQDDATFLKCEGWESKLADTLPIKSESSPIEMIIAQKNGVRTRFILIPIKVRLDIGRMISEC